MQSKYLMEYIPDKQLFKAVMYAREMIRKGESPGLANWKAAKCYRKLTRDVAHYVGQVGGTIRQAPKWRKVNK